MIKNMKEWKIYPNDRLMKCYDNFVVVKPKDSNESIPLACDQCDNLLRDYDDESAYLLYGCCHFCMLEWVQPNVARWINGWRPEQRDVLLKIAQRPPLSTIILPD